MSPTESTLGQTKPRRKVLWLVVVHVVVGVTGAVVLSGNRELQAPQALLVGLLCGQISLLSIWVGFGPNRWYVRIGGLVAGVGYLTIFGGLMSQDWSPRSLISGLAVWGSTFGLAAGLLLIARWFRVRINLTTDHTTASSRTQFSIRDLMLLTFVVACLFAIWRWVGGNGAGQWPIPENWMLLGPFVLIGLIYVSLLGVKRPLPSCMILLAIAAGGEICHARWMSFPSEEFRTLWTTIAVTEAVILTISLLVVRSCGYRLVRLPSRRVGMDSGRQDRSASEEKSAIDVG